MFLDLCHFPGRPSRKAMDSSSTRTASAIGITGRASNTNAGNIEQNLWTAVGSSQSSIIYPPQSPTRMTNNSILKLAGAFHWVKTSRMRFWAFSYSMGEPCERSVQVSMYFIGVLVCLVGLNENRLPALAGETGWSSLDVIYSVVNGQGRSSLRWYVAGKPLKYGRSLIWPLSSGWVSFSKV